MGRLRVKITKSKQREIHKRLKEQFINSIYDQTMAVEIKNRNNIKDTNEITSKQIVSWANSIKAQCSQMTMLESLTENKYFDIIRKSKQRLKQKQNITNSSTNPARQNTRKCRYCKCSHQLRMCLAYGKACGNVAKDNHFKSVCRSTLNTDRSPPQKSRPICKIKTVIMKVDSTQKMKQTDTQT